MANNNKKKALLIGLGLFWATAITATAVVATLTLNTQNDKKNNLVTKTSDQETGIKTTLFNSNEKQVRIKVENLDDYVGQWLTIEYQPKSATTLMSTSSTSLVFERDFFVRSKTEVVEIGGLTPSIKYDFKIKTKQGQELNAGSTFSTFSRPELTFDADQTSISFISSELNPEYLNSTIVVRYKKYEDSSVSPSTYVNSGEVAVAVELKEIEGKSFYAISGKIIGLEESVPYVLTLHIRGQEGSITNPEIVWTKGNSAKLIASQSFAKSVKTEVSGLDDYVTEPNPNAVFWISYTKKGDTETKKTLLDLGTDTVITTPLVNLEVNTEYEANLFKSEEGQELQLAGPISFWTTVLPVVKTKTFAEIETNWRKSDINGKLVISGLNSKDNAKSPSLNSSDLQAIAVEIANAKATPNFSDATALKANLEVDATDANDYNVTLTGLKPEKLYAVQLFKKTDTTFETPLLENVFVETQMPELFTAETGEFTSTNAKVNIKNINNYKTDEVVIRYWKKADESTKKQKVINFGEGVTEVEVLLEGLEAKIQYVYGVFPIYSELQTDDDNLIATTLEFTTSSELAAQAVEGNQFSDNVTFKVSGMDEKFPKNKAMKLQWRVKPIATEPVEWTAPTTIDSHDFTVATIPTDSNYSIGIANHNKVNTWFTGVTYEWRIIDPAKPTENLIKSGIAEFNFTDDKLTETFKAKIAATDHAMINWRAPLIENIVANGLGNSGTVTTYRTFFGLKTKKEWTDLFEWLAFQNDETKNKVFANLKRAFQNYSSNNVEITKKYTAVPYLPNDDNGDETALSKGVVNGEIKFGGISPSANSTYTPIKPSDFMGGNSKLKGWTEFDKAMQYVFNGYKDGWGGKTVPHGISRDNIFGDGLTLSRDKINVSYLTTKVKTEGNFTFTGATGTDADGWTFAIEDSTAANKNFYGNDVTGDIYIKFKITKDSKVHYYWHKVSGLKTNLETDAIKAADLTFELYKDHSRSAQLINKEIELATTTEAKKAIVQKYYKVRLDSTFTEGWTFVSATLSEDKTKLVLKAKLPKKVLNKFSAISPEDKIELTSDAEFTYELVGYDLTSLSPLSEPMSGQAGKFTTTEVGGSNGVTFTNVSWTYEQMLNKMQDAVLQGEAAIASLADVIITGAKVNTQWTTENDFFYFRTMGKGSINKSGKSWYDYTITEEDRKMVDDNKNGFMSEALGTEKTDEKRKELIVKMIKKYGVFS